LQHSKVRGAKKDEKEEASINLRITVNGHGVEKPVTLSMSGPNKLTTPGSN
jgi:hypothetical protein